MNTSLSRDYDILVITGPGDERKDYEVQDVIENRCVYKTPVTVIVHDIEFINKMLSEGQYFFTDIEKEGILLYDAGRVALAERKPFSVAQAKTIAQQYFEQWYGGAKEFYIDAQNANQRRSYKNAAFYLHQAAERAYNALSFVNDIWYIRFMEAIRHTFTSSLTDSIDIGKLFELCPSLQGQVDNSRTQSLCQPHF